MCVCGGRGGGSSDFFHFPKFQGGPTYVIQGGGGRQTFYQGSGVQLLSDRTCDLYWIHIPGLDPRNYHEFQSTTAILSLTVYFRLSSCTHL